MDAAAARSNSSIMDVSGRRKISVRGKYYARTFLDRANTWLLGVG